MNQPVCVSNSDRVAQIIRRDAAGNDLIRLDVLGPHSGDQGVQVLQGIKNLYHVPRTVLIQSGAYEEGGTVGDWPRVDPRKASMTIATKGYTQAELELIETIVWSVLSTKFQVFWRQYDAAGNWRETAVQLAGTPVFQGANIPGQDLQCIWDIELLSGDPYWYSETVYHEFSRADMTPVAGQANTFEYFYDWANVADERCYPQFASGIITATETWTLPDGDGVYTTKNAPTPAQAGQPITHKLPALTPTNRKFFVDTYPTHRTLQVQDQSLQWAKMRAEDFTSWLPESTPTPRTVRFVLTGGTANSQLGIFLRQRWDRPFGGQVIDLPSIPTTGFPGITVYPSEGIYPEVSA